MDKVFVLSILLFTAVNAAPKASDIFGCLAAAGVDVTANFIERNIGNSSEYTEINFQWQERGLHRLPMAYLKVYSVIDIQSAVKCGQSLGLAVVSRNGGHGYLKYTYGQNDEITLILDLQTFNSISVNQTARTATIEAGALTGHVAYRLFENGNFFIPYAGCGSVGISGYTLGGGHSIFSAEIGMSSDNVIEMEMVNADGELLTINNQTNENLFWALRGAGGSGSFGIVTKFVYQLHVAPHQIIEGRFEYNFEQFPQFFPALQTYITTRAKPLFYRIIFDETIVFQLKDPQNITDAETIGVSRIEQIFDSFPVTANLPPLSVKTYPDYLRSIPVTRSWFGYLQPNLIIREPSDLLNITSYGVGSEWFKAKSFFIKKLLNLNEIMELQRLIANAMAPDLLIEIESFSDKISEYDPHVDSAFIHRDAYFHFSVYMARPKEDDPVVSAKLTEFFEKTKELLNHTSSYQNYPDDEMSDPLERYYGANLQRLIDIKTEVDPQNFFNTNPQSIPVRAADSGSISVGVASILVSLCFLMVNILQQ